MRTSLASKSAKAMSTEPGSRCPAGTLRGALGAGRPVENVVSRLGRRYRPTLAEARIEVCGE